MHTTRMLVCTFPWTENIDPSSQNFCNYVRYVLKRRKGEEGSKIELRPLSSLSHHPNLRCPALLIRLLGAAGVQFSLLTQAFQCLHNSSLRMCVLWLDGIIES